MFSLPIPLKEGLVSALVIKLAYGTEWICHHLFSLFHLFLCVTLDFIEVYFSILYCTFLFVLGCILKMFLL